MRTVIFTIVFLSFFYNSSAQIIKGIVFEENTNEPICFATVFFNGTYVGTTSDQDGKFEINTPDNSSLPLTISAIGYYSKTISNYTKFDSLVVFLQPKVYYLEGTTIAASSLKRKRKRYLRLFREEFLGTTANAYECKILNEDDIKFNYGADKDTIKAYTLNPLLIENRALGYKITYYLDKFEHYKSKGSTYFTGNIIFEDLPHSDNKQNEVYKINRKNTYLGSRLHFIRKLWKNEARISGFIIRSENLMLLSNEDLIAKDKNSKRKFLIYPNVVCIEYNNRKSQLKLMKDYVYIEESGFFNPFIEWKGKMASERIADWLPYEYYPRR